MKKIRIPRRPKRLPFKAKFARDARPFGSGERYTSPDLGSIPLLLLCMLGVVILTAAVMLLGKLPKVTAVSAEDGTYYTAAAVLAHAGIEAGDEMLGFDGFAKAKELKKSLPLMDKVKIRKHLNGAVTISFTEVESLYYTCHNQNYYLINAETHEVLNVAGDAAEARRVGAVYLGLPECTRVRVGEELTFINLPYAPETDVPEISTFELETYEPERENAYVFEFVEILMKSSVAERVVGMELGDRYDLWLVLRGGIRIRVGTMDELERKLTLADRSLKDKAASGGIPAGMPTLVDVSDPARIIHRSSPDVELPFWALNG
jgi:cell division septal protein FtsQ